MKTLYIIGGTMGVGKTTVCNQLKKELPNSVFLDGDWCWNSNPLQVNKETKTMVIDNICYLLNNFLRCSVYKNIIFCWVMHEQNIIDSILERLDIKHCNVKCISLITDKDTLRKRLEIDIKNGIRTPSILKKSISRIPLYNSLKTIKINTTNKTVSMIANEIIEL